MKRKKAFMLVLLLAFSIGTIAVSKADDAISVGHGDQIVLTLRNDGLIGVNQTILMTSSKTVEGTFMMNMSLEGILVGKPEITVETPVEGGEVLWKVENNVTLLNVTIKTKVDPFKFRFATLSFVLNGSLTWDGRAWHFQRVFSSTAGSLAPPWIVVKVPKPSEFEDLSFEEMIPVPNVFLEEGSYYTLVWKSEAFLVENTSVTLVRLTYSSLMNWPRVFYRFGPPIITFLVGLAINPAWTRFKKLKQGKKEESMASPSIQVARARVGKLVESLSPKEKEKLRIEKLLGEINSQVSSTLVLSTVASSLSLAILTTLANKSFGEGFHWGFLATLFAFLGFLYRELTIHCSLKDRYRELNQKLSIGKDKSSYSFSTLVRMIIVRFFLLLPLMVFFLLVIPSCVITFGIGIFASCLTLSMYELVKRVPPSSEDCEN